MNKYYDVHNHLFNKHFLGKELLYRMMKELRKFIDLQKDRSLDRGTDRGLKKVITSLKRYRNAIKVFSQQNSIAIYEEINKTYKNEFILTPLTFDLTYCFAPSADRDISANSHNIDEAIEDEMNVMFDMVEEKTRSMSRVFNPYAESDEDKLWNEFLEEKSCF
ncbi:MAG: hypothetical protein IPF54_27140 [Draconibacterium sp.]|nr:hypothetical protein [Draconibacterium sp.]